MKRLTLFLLLFLSIPSLLLSAEAPTDATKVFSIVRDSVFVILSYNAQGKLLVQGSGVAIAPNSVITK